MNTRPTRRYFKHLLAGCFVFLCAVYGYAATITWDGGAADGEWTSATNWDGDTLPADNTTQDAAYFNAGATTVNLSGGNRSVGSVFIDTDGWTFSSSDSSILTVGTDSVIPDPDDDEGQFFLQAGKTMNLNLDLTFTGATSGSKLTLGDRDGVTSAELTLHTDNTIRFDSTATVSDTSSKGHIQTGEYGIINLDGKLDVAFSATDSDFMIDMGTPGKNGTLNINNHLNNIDLKAGYQVYIRDGNINLGADNALDTANIRIEMNSISTTLITGGYTQTNHIEFDGFDLSGRTQTIGGSNASGTTATFSGDILIDHRKNDDADAASIDFESSAGTVVFSGDITTNNNGATVARNDTFRKTGDGTVALSGSNDFDDGSGGTPTMQVTDGILQISNANALGGANGGTDLKVTVDSAATLDIVNNITYTPSNDITISGDGHSNLGAIRSSSGSNTIAAGAGIVMAANASIGVDTGATLTIERAISDGGSAYSLTKAGAGTLNINTAASYTGNTIIKEGTLAIGASDVIADASNLQLEGGTFATSGNNETLGNLTLSASSTIDMASGATSILAFDFNSAATPGWTGTLAITNWDGSGTGNGAEQLVFYGISEADLDDYINNHIAFNGGAVGSNISKRLINDNGGFNDWEIYSTSGTASPIPEPSTYAIGCLLLASGVYHHYRRRQKTKPNEAPSAQS